MVTPCLDHLRIGEPAGYFAAFIQPPPQFCPGDIQDPRAVWNFVIRNVAILVLQVNHHIKGHHCHADLGFMLFKQGLRIVRSIKRLAVGIASRTGVVPTHNEVGSSMILANQGVPNRFPRPAHAHR